MEIAINSRRKRAVIPTDEVEKQPVVNQDFIENTTSESIMSSTLSSNVAVDIQLVNNLSKYYVKVDDQSESIGNRSPIHREQSESIGNRSPDLSEQSESIGNRSPDHKEQSESIGNRSPDHGESAGSIGNRSPDLSEQSESTGNRSPDHKEQSENIGNRSPIHREQSESIGNRSPDHGESVEIRPTARFDPNGINGTNPIEMESAGSKTASEMEDREDVSIGSGGSVPSADLEEEDSIDKESIPTDETKKTKSVNVLKQYSDSKTAGKSPKSEHFGTLLGGGKSFDAIVVTKGKTITSENKETLVELDDSNMQDLFEEYFKKPNQYSVQGAISDKVVQKFNDLDPSVNKETQTDSKLNQYSDKQDNEAKNNDGNRLASTVVDSVFDEVGDTATHELDITIKDKTGSVDFHLIPNVDLFSPNFKLFVRDRVEEANETSTGDVKTGKVEAVKQGNPDDVNADDVLVERVSNRQNCVYVGENPADPQMRVALSNCDGQGFVSSGHWRY